MSDLTQLANGARRRAEQAERTAGRHQEYVDRWEEHVRNRPRGSSARRRAERNLRRTRQRRDRALRRAQRQRAREARYRARAAREAPAPPRPPRRRWVPRTPWQKAFAAALISAGLVTGIAIGGAGGFDPSKEDSRVIIEVEAPAVAPAAPAAPRPRPPAAAPAAPATGGDVDDNQEPVPEVIIDDPAPPSEVRPEASSDTAGEQPAVVAAPTEEATPVQDVPPVAEEIEETAVDQAEQPTPEPRTDELDAARADCFMYLEDYPELVEMDTGLSELCELDPIQARSIIGPMLSELMSS
jgi:hypothetical protein